MKLRTLALIITIGISVTYLLSAFVALDFDPRQWDAAGRLLAAALVVAVTCAILSQYFYENDK